MQCVSFQYWNRRSSVKIQSVFIDYKLAVGITGSEVEKPFFVKVINRNMKLKLVTNVINLTLSPRKKYPDISAYINFFTIKIIYGFMDLIAHQLFFPPVLINLLTFCQTGYLPLFAIIKGYHIKELISRTDIKIFHWVLSL